MNQRGLSRSQRLAIVHNDPRLRAKRRLPLAGGGARLISPEIVKFTLKNIQMISKYLELTVPRRHPSRGRGRPAEGSFWWAAGASKITVDKI